MLRTENSIIERRLEEERVKQYDLKEEIRAYRDTLKQVTQEVCEPLRQAREDVMSTAFTTDNPSQVEAKSEQKKTGRKSERGDSSQRKTKGKASGEVSILPKTKRAEPDQPPKAFSQNPPALVQMLMDSKLANNRLLGELEKSKQNEMRARHEIRRVL